MSVLRRSEAGMSTEKCGSGEGAENDGKSKSGRAGRDQGHREKANSVKSHK